MTISLSMLCHGEQAASVVEYSLLILLIALGCVVATAFLGGAMPVPFHSATGAMNSDSPGLTPPALPPSP